VEVETSKAKSDFFRGIVEKQGLQLSRLIYNLLTMVSHGRAVLANDEHDATSVPNDWRIQVLVLGGQRSKICPSGRRQKSAHNMSE
jgi:hypothetical protein